uniref:Uncharacterized protein n=1 Tax=Opuntia streptacantha TaxID=393608 RepID=A0A7C9DN94_OPUST
MASDGVATSPAAAITTANPPLGFTENNSLTYLATGDPCLDLFFHLVPDTPADEATQMLQKAWDHNPLSTLKLIFNLRGIRGTGKSDKERFFTCALWLHDHHPNTLTLNLEHVPHFGCFKDLVEILFRLLEGPNVRDERKSEWLMRKMGKRRQRGRYFRRRGEWKEEGGFDLMSDDEYDYDYDYDDDDYTDEEEDEERRKMREEKRRKKEEERDAKMEEKKKMKEEKIKALREERSKVPREERVRVNLERMKQQTEKAREERKQREAEKAKRARERYDTDSKYRFLYDKISEVFAKCLMSDLKWFNSGELNKISLASKWCPSIDSAYDKATLICESIAKKVFPREEYPEYEGVEDASYVSKVRDRLRKEVLVPLHKALQMPEIYMGSNQWGSLPYNRVPSVAMKTYKKVFEIHDNERFSKYLEDVKTGKAKIAAGALLPHEIIASLNEGVSEVAELQWKRMVEDLQKQGKLRDCVAVCDVSGSMAGTPMEVCVALGLLISELTEEPWKGRVITFSENPQFHLIRGDDLKSKTEFIRTMDWGANTDFQKVFDQILNVAIDCKLDQDKMVKRIFVFSDMEFDQAARIDHYESYSDSETDVDESQHAKECRSRGWETDYEIIVRKFKGSGFNQVPEIVFWNLRSSRATPVTSNQRGVAMLSGFSKNLMKLFFDKDGSFTPLEAMELAISSEEYQKLTVYD